MIRCVQYDYDKYNYACSATIMVSRHMPCSSVWTMTFVSISQYGLELVIICYVSILNSSYVNVNGLKDVDQDKNID